MNGHRMWMVRAGGDGQLFDDFKNKGLVAIGWDKIGDVSAVKNLDQIKELVRGGYPNASNGQVNIWASQINRFRFEFHKDDYVASYNATKRVYLIGKIESEYSYDKSLQEYHNIRKVKWIKEVSRDALSVSTKNSLGAISTLFEIPTEAKTEMLGILEGKQITPIEMQKAEEEIDAIKQDIRDRAKEFIKDRLNQLDWEQMQELVAGVLRAMGYKTLVSPRGPDRGRDIIASPDGLGLEDPRIVVEVKHREGQMGRGDITKFTGGLRSGTKGLFVSTGGFTKEAKYEAERSPIPVTLADLDLLTQLIIDNYDKFDIEAKELIPLTKIYWPE